MLAADDLGKLSEILDGVRREIDHLSADYEFTAGFGNFNVLLCGDDAQLFPVSPIPATPTSIRGWPVTYGNADLPCVRYTHIRWILFRVSVGHRCVLINRPNSTTRIMPPPRGTYDTSTCVHSFVGTRPSAAKSQSSEPDPVGNEIPTENRTRTTRSTAIRHVRRRGVGEPC